MKTAALALLAVVCLPSCALYRIAFDHSPSFANPNGTAEEQIEWAGQYQASYDANREYYTGNQSR